MGLGNPIEVVAHYLPLGGMIGFDHQDEFLMMSALMCLGLTVSYDIRLLSCYDFIKLVHCVVSQPWENIEFVLKLAVILTYGWDRKLIIYSL